MKKKFQMKLKLKKMQNSPVKTDQVLNPVAMD